MSKRALGKGIDALLAVEYEGGEKPLVSVVPTSSLQISGHQPRKSFSEEALRELADSMASKGVLQPILVEASGEGRYQIVAGERRYRAAKLAGLKEVPVLIRSFSDLEKTEIALIENLQREDLTPVEEALGYKVLIDKGGLTQEEVAKRVGKNRSTVANSLRLLKLPEAMLNALDRGTITAGHARALLSISRPGDQEKLFRLILEREISVREAENQAARLNGTGREKAQKASAGSQAAAGSPHLRALEQRFIEQLGTKVSIRGSENRGKIEITYFSLDDLDRIISIIIGER